MSFFHPVTWCQLTNYHLLKQMVPQAEKKQRHYDRKALHLSMKLVLGAVFHLTSPWLLLPCHSSPLILPLYCSYLPLMPTHRSLLPLLPQQVMVYATASLQGGCMLAGQLVSVKRSDSSSFWSMMWANGKKEEQRCSCLFHSLFFTQVLVSMELLGTSYTLKFLLLCHVNLKLAASL